MIRRFIEKMCGKKKADRMHSWWCNPGRVMTIVIYLAVAVWFVGVLVLNGAIQNWADSMELDRVNLQSQIDMLEIEMSIHRGVNLPEGGP